MRAVVAPETRQGILTAVAARGEFPEAAQEAPAVQGSFDFGTASLREAVPSLRMTELIANWCVGQRGLALSPQCAESFCHVFAATIAAVQKRQTSAAESRLSLGCLTERVELVPFPSLVAFRSLVGSDSSEPQGLTLDSEVRRSQR